MLQKITDDMIDGVLQSDRTFMIMFYSDDLPNMGNVRELIEKYDEQFKGKIDVYECDITKETGKLTQYFQMNTLPAIVMMKYNKAYVNMAGPASSIQFEEQIKKGLMGIMEDSKKASATSNNYSTISSR